MSSDLQYAIAFTKIPGLGPKRFALLSQHFTNLQVAWRATATQLQQAGIPANLAEQIVLKRTTINPETCIGELVQHKVRVVHIDDPAYPSLLAQIPDAPPLLYYRGTLPGLQPTIAIVGTRAMTSYGKQLTTQFTTDLIEAGFAIVSGLALGVDAQSHRICIQHKAQTIAVLGSGLNRDAIYPSQNRYLIDHIIANNGCIVSEYPIGTPAIKQHFPARNRIIAGLAQATLVIEAPKKSGALITAYQALEYNRDVLAVPGRIDAPQSLGCLDLIKKGAAVISSTEDIFEALELPKPIVRITNNSIPQHLMPVYAAIQSTPTLVDTIIASVKIPAQTVLAQLSELELGGYIQQVNNGRYERTNQLLTK